MSCEYTIFSKKNGNLEQADVFYESMDVNCPYNYPSYLNILAGYLYDNLELVFFAMDTGMGKILYPFFKRSLDNIFQISEDFADYSDIISSWYYGGPIITKADNESELVKIYSKAFTEYCSKENIIAEFVRFDPNVENHIHFTDYYNIEYNRETVPVDLQKEYEEIWNGYKGRCRTAIKKAIKSEIKIFKDIRPELIDEFSEIYQKEMERKADSKHYFFPREFFHELIKILPDNFKYFFAYHNDTLCGGTIIYFKGDTVYDFLMATKVDFWKYQPNNILLDYAIKWAKSNGYNVFDLMGGRNGVFKFKSSFSKLRRKFYIGKRVYNDKIYSKLEKITYKIMDSKFSSKFFPVYRQLEDI